MRKFFAMEEQKYEEVESRKTNSSVSVADISEYIPLAIAFECISSLTSSILTSSQITQLKHKVST